MSALMCSGPDLLLQNLHRREERTLRATGAQTRRPRRHQRRELRGGRRRDRRSCEPRHVTAAGAQRRRPLLEEFADALAQHVDAVFTEHGQRSLADDAHVQIVLAENLVRRLLDVFGLPLLDDQDGALSGAEFDPFVGNQRIGDIQQVQRDLAGTECIGAIEQLERSECVVVQTALHHDSDIAAPRVPMTSLSPCSAMNRNAAGRRT